MPPSIQTTLAEAADILAAMEGALARAADAGAVDLQAYRALSRTARRVGPRIKRLAVPPPPAPKARLAAYARLVQAALRVCDPAYSMCGHPYPDSVDALRAALAALAPEPTVNRPRAGRTR